MKSKRKLTKAEKEQRLFNKRIGSIYGSMRNRLGALQFTRATLREKMWPQIGTPCPFCSEALRAKTFSIDHTLPISRGGKKRLSNLQMLCARCNRAKADLTHSEYEALTRFLDTLGPEARKSVLRRLRASPPWLR